MFGRSTPPDSTLLPLDIRNASSDLPFMGLITNSISDDVATASLQFDLRGASRGHLSFSVGRESFTRHRLSMDQIISRLSNPLMMDVLNRAPTTISHYELAHKILELGIS